MPRHLDQRNAENARPRDSREATYLRDSIRDLQTELARYHALLLELLRGASGAATLPPLEKKIYPTSDTARLGRDFLIVTDAVPTPDLDSGSFRLFQILKLLTELGCRVTLACDREALGANHVDQRYIDQVTQLGIAVICGRDAVVDHLANEGHRYAFVLLSRPEIAFRYMFPARAYAIHAKIVYDTVDLHWVRMQRGAELSKDRDVLARALYYERMERFNAASADLVLTVTDSERQALVSAGLDLRVEILPNIHPSADTGGPWQTRHGLMFIGGFWHQPNEDAVCYFVDEVLPLIRRELPDIVLNVIGGHLSDRVSALASPSVRILGYVPDPSTYFIQSRVFVAPLRYGAGLKGKVGHSMSHGLPVVTTPIGAEGMMLAEDETVLIADGAEAFAQAVVRLYSDEQLWSDLSRRSVAHIVRHFSQEAAVQRLASIFSLQSDSDSHKPHLSIQRGPSDA